MSCQEGAQRLPWPSVVIQVPEAVDDPDCDEHQPHDEEARKHVLQDVCDGHVVAAFDMSVQKQTTKEN